MNLSLLLKGIKIAIVLPQSSVGVAGYQNEMKGESS